jgi:hypothetical protein
MIAVKHNWILSVRCIDLMRYVSAQTQEFITCLTKQQKEILSKWHYLILHLQVYNLPDTAAKRNIK